MYVWSREFLDPYRAHTHTHTAGVVFGVGFFAGLLCGILFALREKAKAD